MLLRLSDAASVERSDELFVEALRLATIARDDRCRCLAHYLRGDALLMSGDCGGARTAYREALRCDPDGRAAAFHHALGWTAVAGGDADGAREQFEKSYGPRLPAT
jgi:predicted negative regulator of RcsB-dependent stress response